MLSARLANFRRSSSFKIAAIFMSVFAALTVGLVVLIYFTMERHLQSQAVDFVDSMVIEALEFLDEGGIQSLIIEVNERADRLQKTNTIYVIFDTECRSIAGEPDRLDPAMLEPGLCRSLVERGGDRTFELDRRFSGITRRAPSDGDDEAVSRMLELPDGHFLFIVRVVPDVEETRAKVRAILSWSAAGMVLLGMIGAVLVANAVFGRLERFNSLSRDIRRGHLELRMPVENTGDEFDMLADNLNAMLDKIESLLESVRQVSNNVAHELRTPLTRMRNHLETLKDSSLDDAGREEIVDRVIDDSETLLGVFSALLRIAGVESGARARPFEHLRPASIVEDAVDLFEPLAAEKDVIVDVSLDRSAGVQGDRNLLFEAFANIIENAIKYTPSGGAVRIELARRTGCVIFEVQDSGPGIAPEHHGRVFDPFYRLESHRRSPGSGLGLALVKAVADLHGARIELVGDGGLVFRLEFSV